MRRSQLTHSQIMTKITTVFQVLGRNSVWNLLGMFFPCFDFLTDVSISGLGANNGPCRFCHKFDCSLNCLRVTRIERDKKRLFNQASQFITWMGKSHGRPGEGGLLPVDEIGISSGLEVDFWDIKLPDRGIFDCCSFSNIENQLLSIKITFILPFILLFIIKNKLLF